MRAMFINQPGLATEKAVGAIKWSALMEVVPRAISPVVFLVLARLLTPEDFGVMSTAMIVISFSQIFWEAGLGKALVQIKETPEEAANVVFWTNLGLGIVTYTVLFVAAPWLAAFFKSSASMSVFRILGLQVVIASLASVQSALFVRDLAFRQLFWIKLVTALVPGFFSIPLAFFGYGVWALVAGLLAGSLLNLALVWAKSTWRPQIQFDRDIAYKLFGFGIWVVLEALAVWFHVWGDNLLIGKLIGMAELGIYSIAWSINSLIFGLLLSPFFPVLYPTFSRLRDDIQILKRTFHKADTITIALALPTGTVLLLIGQQLVNILFGVKWKSLGFVLGVIGFMHGISYPLVINAEVYRAIGRPDVNTKLLFGGILYYLPAYLVALQFGLEMFTLVRLVVEAILIPVQVYLCMRILTISPCYLWHDGKSIVVATLTMALVIVGSKGVFTLSAHSFPDLLTLLFLVIEGVVVYGGTLWLLDRRLMLQMKALIRRAVLT